MPVDPQYFSNNFLLGTQLATQITMHLQIVCHTASGPQLGRSGSGLGTGSVEPGLGSVGGLGALGPEGGPEQARVPEGRGVAEEGAHKGGGCRCSFLFIAICSSTLRPPSQPRASVVMGRRKYLSLLCCCPCVPFQSSSSLLSSLCTVCATLLSYHSLSTRAFAMGRRESRFVSFRFVCVPNSGV